MNKKIITGCLIVFFILMLVAGIVAENIYYDSLPEVIIGSASNEHLQALYPARASIIYERQKYPLYIDWDFTSITPLQKNGASIEEGMPIYSVKKTEVELMKNRLELIAFDLKAQNDELLNENMPSERINLRRKINQMEIEELENEIAALKVLFENDGIIYSPHEGIITFFVAGDTPVRSGKEIAVIEKDTGMRFLNWQMPAEEGHLFGVGNAIETTLISSEMAWYGTLEDKEETHTLYIGNIEYFPQTRIYDFTAEIRDTILLNMKDGAQTTIYCRYISEKSYDNVIPTGAIVFESETRGFVFALGSRQRIYGQEYFVTPYAVEIINSLEDKTAITSILGDQEIVLASDKPLAADKAVKIAGGGQ
ncbi:MAG: hypothetical protein FWG91_00730 [Lachnospiraceae bacterium]|nr:hypothetical protein [Lachnospiraceae bacterium]